TLTKKFAIAAVVAVAGIPVMVLTAGQKDAAIVVSAPAISAKALTVDEARGQSDPRGRGEVSFGFAMAAESDPVSIVSMTMTIELGEFVKVRVRNIGTRPVRRVTLRARVTSTARPTNKPHVFNSAPLATWIAAGATVELSSGLLDTKTASSLATDGPVRAEFSVLHVEFADGAVWPALRDPVVTPRTDDSAAQVPYDFNAPGVETPTLMRATNPKYTPEGLRAKIEGVVELQVVVGADGRVQNARVTKSLDTEYGLDEQALLAAREWVFAPGKFNGKAVPTTVVLQMEFRVH
ncbi:MAG: energy transducer TonB, partial [Vicinamibacterales bacterium]